MTAIQRKAIRLGRDLLYSRRSTNIRWQERAHRAFSDYCETQGWGFEQALESVRGYLQRNDVAAVMNGIL